MSFWGADDPKTVQQESLFQSNSEAVVPGAGLGKDEQSWFNNKSTASKDKNNLEIAV